MQGKERRLRRILVGSEKRCLCVPMDHGMWVGPLNGIKDPRRITAEVLEGGATSVLVNPGFLREIHDLVPPHVGLILRVSGITTLSPDVHQEVLFSGIERVLRFDADAVAVTINVGAPGDMEITSAIGRLIEQCESWAMPVMAEMLPADDPSDPAILAHCSRIAFELGADLVKTNYSGDPESYRQVIEAAPIPVIVAGGPKMEREEDLVDAVRGAIQAGAAGVAIGRNIWQSHDPGSVIRRLKEIIFPSFQANATLRV